MNEWDETTALDADPAPVGAAAMSFAEWKSAIADAHWDIDYREFCRRAGFAQGEYTQAKWRAWQNLVAALGTFDAHTLEAIVAPADQEKRPTEQEGVG